MEIKILNDEISVTGQISPDDVAALKAEGFESIICNRPDGEGPGQPDFADIAKVAEKVGMDARYVPMHLDGSAPPPVADFAAAVADLPKPVLAYCKSGGRSQKLWTLSSDPA